MNNKIKLFFLFLIFFLIIFFNSHIVRANGFNDELFLNYLGINPSIVLMISLILLILILFIWEPLPIGVIALSIPVILIILARWTKIDTEQALSGFSNNATITVMAMFVISRGIQNSGAVRVLGSKIEKFAGNNPRKQLGAITGITGFFASAINNTPVVAAFLPMVTNLARRTKGSPSKLLIPLSYASMLGGTMTLLGTSTNILASQISERLINHPFGMFEFTKLGVVVFGIGFLYLITLGYYLIPKRITYENQDILAEYNLDSYLTEVEVRKDSILIGKNVGEIFKEDIKDIKVVQIVREGKKFLGPLNIKTIRAGDKLIIKANEKILNDFIKDKGLEILSDKRVNQDQLETEEEGRKIIELVISDNSFITGQSAKDVHFLERYSSSLLAVRHGVRIKYENLENFVLRAGDVLLLLVNENTLKRLKDNDNFIFEEEKGVFDFNILKVFLGLSIIGMVVLLASLNIISISLATVGGVVVMVVTKLVEPKEIYEAINWEVFFLLAGLIPLGVAIEQTGTAKFIAYQLLKITGNFPPIISLALFYYFTILLTDVISNNASVVLMIPVAVNVAQQLGANPFAFVLAITFAASSGFASPVGYQTNLMIYGPGGYKFRDFIIVGAPLEIILAIVTPIFISIFWGI